MRSIYLSKLPSIP